MTDAAEVRVYDHTGTNLLHTFAHGSVLDLKWSDEVGGGGSCSFSVPLALMPSEDLLDDCVVKIALVRGGVATEVAAYAIRGNSRNHTVGAGKVDVQGESLLAAWGRDAVIRPESSGADMPRAAGEERGLSWVASMYDPATDPDEPWDLLDATTGRSASSPTSDPAWPSGTGAEWITVSNASQGNRKLLRAWLTVTTKTQVRAYFRGDEAATVWLAGEAIIATDDIETGKQTTHKVDRFLQAGTWAVAIDTITHVTIDGGDGVDPVQLAICSLDANGDIASWLLVTGANGWVATRRQITGAGSAPPGPSAGAILLQLADEAAARGVTTWAGITTDFTGALDSDGVAWPGAEERIARYAFDTYGTLIEGLGEIACDCRITPGLVLQARGFEGDDKTASVTIVHRENVTEEIEARRAVAGTCCDALTADGWITNAVTSSVGRREYGLSLGTAPSLSQGQRIVTADLAETSVAHLTGSIGFITQAGCQPYGAGADGFAPGDTVTVSRDSGTVERRVLSLSASGTRPVMWSAELGEAFL